MTEQFTTTPPTLEDLKRINRKLKEELEVAKLERENADLRAEINRLRWIPETPFYTPDITRYTPDMTTYSIRPGDTVLCNNQQ